MSLEGAIISAVRAKKDAYQLLVKLFSPVCGILANISIAYMGYSLLEMRPAVKSGESLLMEGRRINQTLKEISKMIN